MPTRSSRTTTDHNEIRRWAEARGAKPACVKGTGGRGDPGMIRLDFPGYSGADSLEEISWREWFKAFDENGLALVYQDETASGARSNFNKLVARDTAASGRASRGSTARRSSSGSGRTSASSSRASTSSRSSSRSSSTRRSTATQHASGGDGSSLKEREYRDAAGGVHHHTRKYMAAHRGSRGGKR